MNAEYGHLSKDHPAYDHETDNRICFKCCGDLDREALIATNVSEKVPVCLYLTHSNGKYKITNWPETLEIPVHTPRKGRHNIAGVVRTVWFQYEEQSYIGRNYGEWSDICHVKRIKP